MENTRLEARASTLERELASLAEETSSLSAELTRARLVSSSATEGALGRERELRDEVERLRGEREGWEVGAERERARAEEEERRGRELEGEARRLEGEVRRERDARDRERERANNLQSVLEEFQAGESFLRELLVALQRATKLKMVSVPLTQPRTSSFEQPSPSLRPTSATPSPRWVSGSSARPWPRFALFSSPPLSSSRSLRAQSSFADLSSLCWYAPVSLDRQQCGRDALQDA